MFIYGINPMYCHQIGFLKVDRYLSDMIAAANEIPIMELKLGN